VTIAESLPALIDGAGGEVDREPDVFSSAQAAT
jgi:hypothetical protein